MTHPKLAVIVHGWGESPSDGWFPWLKTGLEARGYAVIVPAMPRSDVPEITPWVQTLQTILANNPAKEVLLVGHSIGCQAILRYLAEAYVPVDKAIFVAGWVELTGLDDEENDPVVPLAPNQKYFENQVGSEVVVLNKYGHFDEDSGVTQVPELLPYI